MGPDLLQIRKGGPRSTPEWASEYWLGTPGVVDNRDVGHWRREKDYHEAEVVQGWIKSKVPAVP